MITALLSLLALAIMPKQRGEIQYRMDTLLRAKMEELEAFVKWCADTHRPPDNVSRTYYELYVIKRTMNWRPL